MEENVTSEMPMKPPAAWWGWLRRNPVALKELRGRMRGARAFIVLTVYVLLMSAFTVVLYGIYTISAQVTLSTTGGVIGKVIFGGVLSIELFLVCFIAPAFTASAISGERERRTYHLLRTTLLSADNLIWGKLLAALGYIVLLLVVAIPLQSLAFLMGGVTMTEVLLSIEILVVTAVTYGAIGIYFSATMQKTLTASVLTYVIALILTIALPLLTFVMLSFVSVLLLSSSGSGQIAEYLLFAVFALLACSNPIATAILSEVVLQQNGSAFYFTQTFPNGWSVPLPSPWIAYTVIYLLVALILMRLSVVAVRRVDQ